MYKVITIEDTRSWDWSIGKPIPGSGCQRPCDHCGKTHDVVVTVEKDGKRMDVGTTCAKKLGAWGKDYDSKALKVAAIDAYVKQLALDFHASHGRLVGPARSTAIDAFLTGKSTDAIRMDGQYYAYHLFYECYAELTEGPIRGRKSYYA